MEPPRPSGPGLDAPGREQSLPAVDERLVAPLDARLDRAATARAARELFAD